MKTAKEKYENSNNKGEVIKKTPKGMMYISSPREIAEIIKKIPSGKFLTVSDIAKKLAEKHQVDFTCPLTTGIFISVIANYVDEEKVEIPYWRVVKTNGQLYGHYFRQESDQLEHLRQEGVEVLRDNQKNAYFVNI